MTHLSVVLVVRHLIAHRRQVDVIVVIEGMACVTLKIFDETMCCCKRTLAEVVWHCVANQGHSLTCPGMAVGRSLRPPAQRILRRTSSQGPLSGFDGS